VQGDTISFGQIVSTEIACLDQAVTEQEQRYFEALHKIIISTPSRLGLKHPTH
jgi:heat shock protein HslJ